MVDLSGEWMFVFECDSRELSSSGACWLCLVDDRGREKGKEKVN
jgi:hypothetical protein